MNRIQTVLAIVVLAVAASASGQEAVDYTDKVGEVVDVFEHPELNYRLELADAAYTYIDFSTQVPEASFAAIRFRPNAFSIVVTEDLGPGLSAQEYAEIVQIAMKEKLEEEDGGRFHGSTDIGLREHGGMAVFQKTMRADVGAVPITYVLSTIVDGARAYQLLTFASNEPDEVVVAEANRVLEGFSIIDADRNATVVATNRPIRDYRSATFGYRFRAKAGGWFAWTDLAETNDGADIGALSAQGYGTVVLPMCWVGPRPADNAIFRVMMQQFGEDYPSDFISEEHAVRKGDATGKLLVGTEEAEGRLFVYYQWIVANERCAYTLAAWGPAGARSVDADLRRLWKDFDIDGVPTASEGHYTSKAEREVNAYLVNALGLHYYEARSFRDAFRLFDQASSLVPDDEAYVVNAVRSLVEIDAFREAADWITPRMAPYADNQLVRSWDAWLAYQTDDSEKALRIYDDLFDNAYRDDDDFSAYMSMLADAGRWEDVDREFDEYTAVETSEKTQLLHVKLLARRERFDEALAILDRMTEGRPFDPDLAYERIAVVDQMNHPAEVLRLADLLIENGYRSLQSYFYKGDAQYQLRSYREARESFEQALSYAPANANVREYLAAIDHVLGEGDTATISQAIEAVALPRRLEKTYSSATAEGLADGYGAVYLGRISGYRFDGSDVLHQTLYRRIQVLDDNGVTQFSTLEFDFDPAYEQFFVNRLRVHDADGDVIAEGDIDNYYITHSESGYEASTEKTVHLPVPSLAPGAIIEAVVTRRTSVEPGSFPLETLYLSSDRPVAFSAVFVTGEYDRLHYELSGVRAPRRAGESLVWELDRPVPFRWEPLQPFYDQILPWVQLGTVHESWSAAGREYLDLIEDKLDDARVTDRAQRLVDGVEGTARQVEILSAFVQEQIRYEAIEFGRRAYIPKTARETLRDRYGDCKDHAVLLYSLLRAVGIDASLALVNLSQQIVPGLPNTDQFDHMIVSVRTDDGRVFIDATDKDLRLGRLSPRSMAGNFALELGPEPELIRMPDYDAALTGIRVERLVEPREPGRIDVTETARFTGYQAAELRGQLRGIESSEMQGSLQRWVATRYPDAELTDYFVDNVFDAGNDLLFEIRYTMPLDAGGTFDLPGFLEAYYLEFDRIADRRFPFEHLFPLRVAAVTSVRPPEGRQVEVAAAKPAAGESKFGSWRREISRDDGGFEIRFDYVASEARFGPDDYREFSEFQREAVKAIESRMLLK